MSALPVVIISEPTTMISDVLRVEFSCLGFIVLLAANGQEAEEFASQTLANLVVLDVSTMKLSGYAACARIRRQSGYANQPIILTVGEISTQDTAAAEAAGATGLLAKPYSMNDLIQAVMPHLPAGDPLLTHPSQGSGMAEAPREWKPLPRPAWRFGAESGLSRNGRMLPIFRGQGVRMPLIRKP